MISIVSNMNETRKHYNINSAYNNSSQRAILRLTESLRECIYWPSKRFFDNVRLTNDCVFLSGVYMYVCVWAAVSRAVLNPSFRVAEHGSQSVVPRGCTRDALVSTVLV